MISILSMNSISMINIIQLSPKSNETDPNINFTTKTMMLYFFYSSFIYSNNVIIEPAIFFHIFHEIKIPPKSIEMCTITH